jgi:hypothetical protein
MTPRSTAWIALWALCLACPAFAAKDGPGRKSKAAPAAAASTRGCKEPAPRDPDLVAGLTAYAAANWAGAATSLGTWAARPEAEKDPAAARGMYALAYSLRATGSTAAAEAALARAQPLLEARTQSNPTLEAWYYLQGLHQMKGDEPAQLAAISSALQALEGGRLCAERDGDDWFRIARMNAIAGDKVKQSESLNAASAAYEKAPQATASPYRAMVEKDLGEAALTSNDLASAEKHLAAAAKLDPTIPGVHRQLGLVYLRRGNVEAAATHWRRNWKNETQNGNAFMYAIPVMQKILAFRAKPGMEPLTGLSQFTVPALEQNAISEAKIFGTLQQEKAAAQAAGTPFPPGKEAELAAAEYRSLQYMLEYVTRGEDLQEFALQNGLLPIIHGRSLPSR